MLPPGVCQPSPVLESAWEEPGTLETCVALTVPSCSRSPACTPCPACLIGCGGGWLAGTDEASCSDHHISATSVVTCAGTLSAVCFSGPPPRQPGAPARCGTPPQPPGVPPSGRAVLSRAVATAPGAAPPLSTRLSRMRIAANLSMARTSTAGLI